MLLSFTFLASQYLSFLTATMRSWGFHSFRMKGPLPTKLAGLIQSLPNFAMACMGMTAKA